MGLYPILHTDYSEIDDILDRWAGIHQFRIHKEYKEVEVRSILFCGDEGISYQLWVEPPNEKGFVEIHVWDYEKRRIDVVVKRDELFEKLELAYRSIQEPV